MENKTKNIYIFSSKHSGSTLLDMLIGSNSNAVSLGEITHLPKNIALNTPCSCGNLINKCDFWKKVCSEIQLKNNNFLKQPYKLDLGFIKASKVIDKNHQTKFYNYKCKFYHALRYAQRQFNIPYLGFFLKFMDNSVDNTVKLYDIVRDISKAYVVVDSSKVYIKGIDLYLRHPDRTKVILLTRDGRGVLYSSLKRQNPLNSSVFLWTKYYSRTLSLINKYVKDADVIRVKYEDLVENTDKELKRICDIVNLTYESNMKNFTEKIHHIANGNDMRLSKTSTINLDKTWKKNLTKPELEYFNRYAGELNKSFGYE